MSDDAKTKKAVERALLDYHRTLWLVLDAAGAPTVNEDGVELLTVPARIEEMGQKLRDEMKAQAQRISDARDAALEEAALYHYRKADEARRWLDEQEKRANTHAVVQWRTARQTHRLSGVVIRALKAQPARRYLDAERVREALDSGIGTAPGYMSGDEASAFEDGWAAAVRHIEDCLGLELDATPASDITRSITDHPDTWGTKEDALAFRAGKPLVWKGEKARPSCARCGHTERLHHAHAKAGRRTMSGCSGWGDANSDGERGPCVCSGFLGSESVETTTVENGLLPALRKPKKKR